MINGYMNGYNNNLPPQAFTGYNPQNYGFNQPQPTIQPQSLQPQTNNGIFTEFRFMTQDELKAQLVNPNCRLLGLDKEKMKLGIKATDSLGNTSIEYFNLSKESDTIEIVEPMIKKEDLDGYVTKENLSAELGTLKTELNKKFEALNKSIDLKRVLEEDKHNGK